MATLIDLVSVSDIDIIVKSMLKMAVYKQLAKLFLIENEVRDKWISYSKFTSFSVAMWMQCTII